MIIRSCQTVVWQLRIFICGRLPPIGLTNEDMDIRSKGTPGWCSFPIFQQKGCEERGATSQELDELGIDLDSEGEEIGDLYNQPLDTGTASGHQTTLIAVQSTAYNENLTAIHGGRDLFGGAVTVGELTLHYGDEPLHFFVPHDHGVVLSPTPLITVLEGVVHGYDGVELGPGLPDKQKIIEVGHLLHHPLTASRSDTTNHGGEDLQRGVGQLLKQLVSVLLGIGTLEVAQYEPLFVGQEF